MEGNTARGASSPANPALHIPDPLSHTSAVTSSSHILAVELETTEWMKRADRRVSSYSDLDLHDSNERERELLVQNGKNQNSSNAQNAQCQNSGQPGESGLHSIDLSLPGTMLAEPATSSKQLVPGRVAAVPAIELVAGAAASESVPSHFSAPSINSLDERPHSRSVASQTDSEDQFLKNYSNTNLKRTFEELGFNLDDTDLTPDEKLRFKSVIEEFSDVFCLSNAELSGIVLGKLELKLKPGADVKYSRARIYPMSTPDRLELERQVSDLLKWGFIERSKSRLSSSAFLVKKAGSFGIKRVVYDYRTMNQMLEKDSYDLPTVQKITEKLVCSALPICPVLTFQVRIRRFRWTNLRGNTQLFHVQVANINIHVPASV